MGDNDIILKKNNMPFATVAPYYNYVKKYHIVHYKYYKLFGFWFSIFRIIWKVFRNRIKNSVGNKTYNNNKN